MWKAKVSFEKIYTILNKNGCTMNFHLLSYIFSEETFDPITPAQRFLGRNLIQYVNHLPIDKNANLTSSQCQKRYLY